MDTRTMLRDYLDRRSRQARYAAVNWALCSVMLTWEKWMQAAFGSNLDKYAMAPVWAEQGIRQWLDGEVRVQDLGYLLPILEETHRRTSLSTNARAEEAALVCLAAQYMVTALVEETGGSDVHREDAIHACDAVLVIAEINDQRGDHYTARPYVARFMEHVDEHWPVLQ